MNRDMVLLAGQPAEVGRVYGRVTATCTQRYVADFLVAAQAASVSETELSRRADRYRTMVDELAPWWHEEIAAIAAGAGVDLELYTAYIAQKYVIPSPATMQTVPHECTSFMAIGRASETGTSLLHKNRDSYPRAQGLWTSAVNGSLRYLGGGDAGDHGVIHFVNERGLAGAMNAGSPNEDCLNEGLPTPEILRLVAEKALDCRDALAIVQDVVRRGWYTNGKNGSLWLFADPHRGLVLENTWHSLDYAWIDNAICVRANDFRLPGTAGYAREGGDRNPRLLAALEAMTATTGHITAHTMKALSRDDTSHEEVICGNRTLSGFTAELTDRQFPLSSIARVALGQPKHAPYVPWYVSAQGLPAFVVDGSLWTLAAELQAAGPMAAGRWAATRETFEERVEGERRTLEAEVQHLIGDGRAGDGVRLLTATVAGWAEQALEILESSRPRAPQEAGAPVR